MVLKIDSEIEGKNAHFHAGPKGLGGLVIPGVNDTAPHMLAFRGGLFGTCSFLDIDSELGFGPAVTHCAKLAAATTEADSNVGGKEASLRLNQLGDRGRKRAECAGKS